jgi:putative ABC transport system ATP-binding protein
MAIMGPSGSGKSTLLSTLGGLLRPSSGIVSVGGIDVYRLTERERTRWRLLNIGYISQTGGLLDELTVEENIQLPVRLGRTPRHPRQVDDLLERLGLSEYAHCRADELSGGQVQRTAIARSLMGSPTLVLADEPTGALDDELSAEVGQLLADVTTSTSTTLIVATHDTALAERADEILALRRGSLHRC